MNARLRHRGPDDSGEYVDRGIGIAMRRLSIQDVAGGKQPVFNEDGSVVVVYNGEIYNAPELKDRLAGQGHVFRSRTDTEVLVHLYEEYGEDLVTHLRGMFAFALWDKRRESLLLARDRIGKKPLYYTVCGDGTLVFASELSALRECPAARTSLDPEAIRIAAALQYIPSPATPFRDVHKLPAGHLAVFKSGAIQPRRYWRLGGGTTGIEYASAVDGLSDRLQEAVRLRLLSDVPLGALLSGGVDSSAVVGLMQRVLDHPVKTFAVRFDSPGGQADAAYARSVAESFGCEHRELFVGDDAAVAAVPAVFDSLDDPVLDPAHLPTYLVCRMAREHVKVVLTGEGGDEAFAGYARYRLAGIPSVPASFPARIADALAHRDLVSTRSAKAINAICERDPARRHVLTVSPMAPGDYRRVFGCDPGFVAGLFSPLFAAHADSDLLNRTLAVDVETWLADDLLQKVDRMSMAVSLEARTPLLDHELMEYAHRLPGHFKLKGGVHKRIFKAAVRNVVPAGIIARRKVGFEPPWGEWFRGRLRDNLRDSLSSAPFRNWAFIDHSEVARLVERHERTGRHGLGLYCLFALAEWGRRHAAQS